MTTAAREVERYLAFRLPYRQRGVARRRLGSRLRLSGQWKPKEIETLLVVACSFSYPRQMGLSSGSIVHRSAPVEEFVLGLQLD
ncbi:MAG: hypothetical protein JWL80_202 [Parcubacteria group bacterium]|nr:hypothetical protein [Parcubacteria group bacterium]